MKKNDWARRRIDYFVLSRLEQEGLGPSPEASRQTLIRRVTYALTGLPPVPEEIDRFLQDNSPDAYELMVERLLGSSRFGERLTSMWLTVARYAEDQAHQVGDDAQNFYPNAHHYRKWVIDAFNDDVPYDRFIKLQLAADLMGDTLKSDLPALGFIGIGPKYYNRGRLEVMADEWEDRVDTVTRSFLGLTVACARCHDHKFDPITMKDYYGLAGVFASTTMVNKTADGEVEEKGKKEEKDDKKSKSINPKMLHIVEESEVKDLNVFLRGNVGQKGPQVHRRFLEILCDGQPVPFEQGSGRLELASAIADPQNPLTARVMANRIWMLVFGNPLVATPSNFGNLGGRPANPHLLDDLAMRFTENGWSVKWLVREMVLSAAFRQSSRSDPAKASIDEGNRFLWRMHRRRLEVEQWRDAVLFVSGDLEWIGGKSRELDDPGNLRRTVYGRVSRLQLNDFLVQFDYPDANVHSSRRPVTTTATQKLFVLNSPFILRQAKSLASRLTANPSDDTDARVQNAYRMLYGRVPEPNETRWAVEFLDKPGSGEMSRWEQYAQALLAANEMMYLD
ncbi:MAG: DUF1549 and DUF1553 domain-containing protein [Verrucomicrobia bacterium]|nr:DUF1549 and DUF1553 domain-containing protein [Verrucomicrobiota bacterium]